MDYNFNLPVRMVTGPDCVRKNAALFAQMGKKAMLVTGGSSAKRSGALADVTAALEEQGIDFLLFDGVRQNPLITDCKRAGELARKSGVEFLIGIGGGSPLDATKAIAVFAANDIPPANIYDLGWTNPALPFALVGTTAGTASELTAFSVLTQENGRKRSFACQQSYARYSFGDPKYTYSLPLDFTLSTTLDALSHAIEGYYAAPANRLSDLFAIEAVGMLAQVYRELRCVTDAAQITPSQRDRLYYASLTAGFPLNHCGTCYCHTLGYFLSEDYGIPHGYACAVTLPDFIARCEAAQPEKARTLYAEAKTSREELTELIGALNRVKLPALSAQELDAITDRFSDDIPNFKKTPGRFTASDADKLLRTIFQ